MFPSIKINKVSAGLNNLQQEFMKKRSIEETIEKIKKENSSLKACSAKEIEDLELFYKIKLPASYKSFLAVAGKDSGNLMIGSEYSYKHLFKLKEIANELLIKNNQPMLPADAFVFWMHQGYQFSFFYLSDGENPMIYYFNECEKNIPHIKSTCRFTDYLYYYDEGYESLNK